MKISILKFTVLLFIFSLTIGCSTEKEDTLEQQVTTTNLLVDPIGTTVCANPDLDTEGYVVGTVFVEFEPGLNRAEKHAIRAPYCSNIISIEPCPERLSTGEIWTVRGPCHNNGPLETVCQPGVLPPTDPDLRQAVVTSECLPPSTGMFLPEE